MNGQINKAKKRETKKKCNQSVFAFKIDEMLRNSKDEILVMKETILSYRQDKGQKLFEALSDPISGFIYCDSRLAFSFLHLLYSFEVKNNRNNNLQHDTTYQSYLIHLHFGLLQFHPSAVSVALVVCLDYHGFHEGLSFFIEKIKHLARKSNQFIFNSSQKCFICLWFNMHGKCKFFPPPKAKTNVIVCDKLHVCFNCLSTTHGLIHCPGLSFHEKKVFFKKSQTSNNNNNNSNNNNNFRNKRYYNSRNRNNQNNNNSTMSYPIPVIFPSDEKNHNEKNMHFNERNMYPFMFPHNPWFQTQISNASTNKKKKS